MAFAITQAAYKYFLQRKAPNKKRRAGVVRRMKRGEGVSETHILVLPFPSQGHINPMLQFSRRLASKGVRVTVAIPTPTVYNVQASSVDIEIICERHERRKEGESIENYMDRFRMETSESLEELIKKNSRSSHPAKFLVYDSMMPWAYEVAEQLGLDGIPFFTQSCAVSTIYYHFYEGKLKIPLPGSTVSIPSMPLLCINDLPTFINDQTILTFLLKQFSNFQKVKWILFNTFDKLEDEGIRWMANLRPIKTIGPTVPSMYLDKRLEEDKDYGLNLFKQNVDACTTWLDTKDIGSVVYVSFGSLASLGEEQMEEIARGLQSSNTHFIWVVRESEEIKLPSNFLGETCEKGLVVRWCSQLEVLSHKGIGCFMSHCGWNSTLEALSLGVPMIAMPHFSDQSTNAKYIEDVWGVGVRVKADEKGLVKGEEIDKCIREIMEGERGNEARRNAEMWKELAKEAVADGGTSDDNIQQFVAEILCS